MGIKDGGNIGQAARYAQGARTAKAGSFHGGNPPPGPKAEPLKLNGVPAPRESGVSKK